MFVPVRLFSLKMGFICCARLGVDVLSFVLKAVLSKARCHMLQGAGCKGAWCSSFFLLKNTFKPVPGLADGGLVARCFKVLCCKAGPSKAWDDISENKPSGAISVAPWLCVHLGVVCARLGVFGCREVSKIDIVAAVVVCCRTSPTRSRSKQSNESAVHTSCTSLAFTTQH